MPQCFKCKEFMPPDMVSHLLAGTICHFCEKGQDTIMSDDGTLYVKKEVVMDYKALIDKLKDSSQIKKSVNDMIVETAVQRMNNGK